MVICKCQHPMTATNIGVGNNISRILMHYCHKCGRVCVKFSENQQSWLESDKSKNANLVQKGDVINILNKKIPEGNKSIKDKTKIEIINDIMGEVNQLR